MPPVVGAAIVGAGTQLVSHSISSKANERAQLDQRRAADEAMRLERERDAEARRQWEAEQAQRKLEWDRMEQDRLARETRLTPYRQASAAALGRLGDLLGPQGQSAWRSPSQVGRSTGTLGALAGRS